MTTIQAESILASRNVEDPNKDRVLHTIKARYPLWIHQELLTHRAFSRNSASSRAIPITKLINEAMDDPAMPIYWTKNEPGMQGYQYLSKLEENNARDVWLRSRDEAVKHAMALADLGAHKQVANRLLGPYIHVTVVVSATEWANFIGVRTHHSVEPHMRDLAWAFAGAMKVAKPQSLKAGEWHVPFVTKADWKAAHDIFDSPEFGGGYEDLLIPLSVARCASVSYKTVEGLDMDFAKANTLYAKLVNAKPIHVSPAEHVAQADFGKLFIKRWQPQIQDSDDKLEDEWVWRHAEDHRNFVGFRQWRAQLKGDTL